MRTKVKHLNIGDRFVWTSKSQVFSYTSPIATVLAQPRIRGPELSFPVEYLTPTKSNDYYDIFWLYPDDEVDLITESREQHT